MKGLNKILDLRQPFPLTLKTKKDLQLEIASFLANLKASKTLNP